jgi:hypothetical protein
LWESPISSIPRNAGQKDDFMFFYERVESKAVESIAADKESAGKSVGGKEVGAGKPVAISSGKKYASDDQKVGKQDHGPVGEGTKKKNEPVAGNNSKLSSLDDQKVGSKNVLTKQKVDLAGKDKTKQTRLAIGMKISSDDQKAGIKKVADLKKLIDSKRLLDIKRIAENKKAAGEKKKNDLMGAGKMKKKKKMETHPAGNTVSAVRADSATLYAKQKVDDQKVSTKQNDGLADDDKKKGEGTEPVASKPVSASGTDHAALQEYSSLDTHNSRAASPSEGTRGLAEQPSCSL